MTEKTPSISSLKRSFAMASAALLLVSIILALVWSYYSSEWWSVAIGLLAVYFLIESIAHGVYEEMVDLIQAMREHK